MKKKELRRKARRENAATILSGIGFIIFLVFGSAIDGPGNDMRLVYTGIAIGMSILAVGITIGGWWE